MRFERGFSRIRPHLIYITSTLVGIFIAMTIVVSNPYFWLAIVCAPIFVVLIRNKPLGLYFIMFSVFFADWFYGLGFIPTQLTWIPEVVLILLLFDMLIVRRRMTRTPLDFAIIGFLVISTFSIFANSRPPLSALLALRLDLKFVLMFYIIVSLNFEEKVLKQLLSFLTLLLIIQIPVAIIKFFVYGQMEAAVGTYTAFGGELSTILPLLAISFFLGFYIHCSSKRNLRYILPIFGYMIFPILAMKKGFIFFAFMLFVFFLYQARSISLIKKLLPIILISLPFLLAGIYFVPGLRPALKNPYYLVEFSLRYENYRTPSGEAGGRLLAIKETFSSVKSNNTHLLVGYGPGSTIKSYFSDYDMIRSGRLPVRIAYGFTHLVTTVIEYGYLGFVFYFLFPIIILYKVNKIIYKKASDPYWKAVSFGFSGILFSALAIGLFYWDLFREDVVGFIFWLFAAILFSVAKRNRLL